MIPYKTPHILCPPSIAPSDPHLKLAIHCKGDWTGALRDRFDLADFARKLPPSPLNSPAEVARLVPAIELDGPFDTAATDFADRDVAVFVAAGVGITPFMSCLRWLMHELTSSSSSSSSAHLPRRVHLIWTVRDATHFTWFNSTLRALESDPRLRDTITLHLHCTGNKDRDAPAPIAHGLKLTPAHAGRPDLGAVLTGVREEARGMVSAVDGRHASVGVYCVGPAALCADVRKVSWRLSEDATPFTVHCEQS